MRSAAAGSAWGRGSGAFLRRQLNEAAAEGKAAASASPNAHPLIGRQEQALALLDVEGRVPGVEVPHGEGAEVAGGVAVGGDALPERLVAHLGGPGLGVGDEEALVTGEAVDDRRFLAVQRGVIGVVGGGQAG